MKKLLAHEPVCHAYGAVCSMLIGCWLMSSKLLKVNWDCWRYIIGRFTAPWQLQRISSLTEQWQVLGSACPKSALPSKTIVCIPKTCIKSIHYSALNAVGWSISVECLLLKFASEHWWFFRRFIYKEFRILDPSNFMSFWPMISIWCVPQTGLCAANVGVKFLDSLDDTGRERFHPFWFSMMIDDQSLLNDPWFTKFNYHPVRGVSWISQIITFCPSPVAAEGKKFLIFYHFASFSTKMFKLVLEFSPYIFVDIVVDTEAKLFVPKIWRPSASKNEIWEKDDSRTSAFCFILFGYPEFRHWTDEA